MVHISTLLIVTWFTASSIALPVDHNDLPERATYEILSDNSANAHGSHCDPTHPIPSCSNSQVPPPEVHRSHSDLTNRQSSPSIDGITEDALKMWTRHLLNSKYRDTIEQGFLVNTKPTYFYAVDINFTRRRNKPGIKVRYQGLSTQQKLHYNTLYRAYNTWGRKQRTRYGEYWWKQYEDSSTAT